MPTFMPGIIPDDGPISNVLIGEVRRAFIPRVVLEVYKRAPVITGAFGKEFALYYARMMVKGRGVPRRKKVYAFSQAVRYGIVVQ